MRDNSKEIPGFARSSETVQAAAPGAMPVA
jgi:hypothetical protein